MGALGYISTVGNKADKSPRRFLAYSHIIQQLSFITIFTTPIISTSLFLPIAGSANILSNISFAGIGLLAHAFTMPLISLSRLNSSLRPSSLPTQRAVVCVRSYVVNRRPQLAHSLRRLIPDSPTLESVTLDSEWLQYGHRIPHYNPHTRDGTRHS